MTTKERKGYLWVDTGNGQGYWSKVKGEQHSHRIAFFCPNCNKLCGEVDTKWLEEYGFCWECHTLYVEDRTVPAIDLDKFRPQKKQ